MLQDRPQRLPWPRSQRFTLSPRGTEAEIAYREAIAAARATGNDARTSFDLARSTWAAANGLEPDDGLYLGETKGGPVNLQHLVAALETCGKSRADAIQAVARLVDAGLIQKI